MDPYLLKFTFESTGWFITNNKIATLSVQLTNTSVRPSKIAKAILPFNYFHIYIWKFAENMIEANATAVTLKNEINNKLNADDKFIRLSVRKAR